MNRRVAGGLAIGLLTAVVLAGCGANGNSSSGMQADSGLANPMQGASAPEVKEAMTPPGESKPEAKTAADSAAQNRQMIRTASVDLEGQDVTALLGRVKDLGTREGGFVGQENSTSGHGTVTLRVPSDRLDTVLKGLGELEGATVTHRESRTEDVTDQIVDVEARLSTQRASVDRVRALLERASTTSEITTIESELTKRQSELESLQRRYESLKGQSSLSTLTVSVRKAGAPPPAANTEEAGFLSALSAGWGALLVALRWLLVVLGGALPFLVVIGVPLAAVLYFRRKRTPVVQPAPSESTN